jgi:hypothetical protein
MMYKFILYSSGVKLIAELSATLGKAIIIQTQIDKLASYMLKVPGSSW